MAGESKNCQIHFGIDQNLEDQMLNLTRVKRLDFMNLISRRLQYVELFLVIELWVVTKRQSENFLGKN